MDREEVNAVLLEQLSGVLYLREPVASQAILDDLMGSGLDLDSAMRVCLMTEMGLDVDEEPGREIFRRYLPKMLRKMEKTFILDDPYVKAMAGAEGTQGDRVLALDTLRAREVFLRNDLQVDTQDRVLPPLGYMLEDVQYPVILDQDGSWMSCEPFEIATLRPCAQAAKGKVVSLGLGLGYYAFHALLNPKVSEVICVERDGEIIELFNRCLRSRFPRQECLKILQTDAFDYVQNQLQADRPDTVMVDLWRDAGDGMELYQHMKQMETPGPVWQYWIEDMIRYYLKVMEQE